VHPFPRLYPILDLDTLAARRVDALDLLDVWLGAGVTLWQLRAKSLASGPLLRLVDMAVERSHRAGARLIVNDRADVAAIAGAAGVHVGQTDLSPADVRRLVGSSAIVGRSTHDEAQAEAACLEPISYLAIGPVFGTTSKAGADPVVGIAGVRRAVALAARRGLPVVAIGGITLEQAPAVLRAGAAAIAVISDLLDGDPGARIVRYQQTVESLTL
jgi:thiamine-phosphate pyrophosphorylase